MRVQSIWKSGSAVLFLLAMPAAVWASDVSGIADHVDLRCDFHRAVAEANSGTGLRLPEEWGDCRIYVFGEPGAKFKIVEYADSEFVTAPST